MDYVSLYRRWRPQTFGDIVGQGHVVRTLRNAVSAGRIAHAYLFAGPRGTGKTSTARVLARALNCEHGPTPDPCGKCASCVSIRDGNAMDVIEIDAASNRGIEEIRDLREKVVYAPTQGRYKIYIIDEAHMLTVPASNALLKTLEEPPAHVVFVLATTQPESIIGTIVSRCQRFDFNRLTASDLAGHIARVAEAQSIPITADAVSLIARRAEGSARDALGLLEQASAWSENVTSDSILQLLGVSDFETVAGFADAALAREPGPMFRMIQETTDAGADPRQFLQDLVVHFRNLLVAKECPGAPGLIDVAESYRATLSEQARKYSRQDLLRAIRIVGDGMQEMRRSSSPRLSVELTAARLCAPEEILAEPRSEPRAEPRAASAKAQSGEAARKPQRAGAASGVSAAPLGPSTKAAPAEPGVGVSSIAASAASAATAVTAASGAGAGRTGASVPGARSRARGQYSGITPEQWGEVLARVKGQKVILEAFLREVVSVEVDEGQVRIVYEPDWSVHMQKASEPDNRRILSMVMSEILGRSVTVEPCTTSASRATGLREEAPEANPVAPSGALQGSTGMGRVVSDIAVGSAPAPTSDGQSVGAQSGGISREDGSDDPGIRRAMEVFSPVEVRMITK